jgi:hypothetical protein
MTTPPVIIADANVLYSFTQRDLLFQLRMLGVMHWHWTVGICDEWVRNLSANRALAGRSDAPKILKLVADIEKLFPDIQVAQRPDLEDRFPAVHANDRHVAAAALGVVELYSPDEEDETEEAKVPVWLVTWNLRHFPAGPVAKEGVRVCTPDEAFCDLLIQAPDDVCKALKNQISRMSVSKPDFAGHCQALAEKDRLANFAQALQAHSSLFGAGWPP